MKTMIKRGLIAIAPLALTIGILYWLFSFMEELVGPPMKTLLGKYYVPGMGIVGAIIILFIIGSILNTWLISHVTHFFERVFKKIPLFNSLYKMVKNVTHFFQSSPEGENQQVVEVSIAGQTLVGFITRENFSEFPAMETDRVAVFLPMSYQIGGYTVLLPRSEVKPLDMSIEEALQYSLIAWARKPED
ncbi:DUF502 domain-containing protein [Candidatus Neptunochlamydia vexilliferae]|uniref:DUF502 domain-containing protein n=1 Tax=Candidatus Neptunichlamydia vexilliferae TaxID=1651774 RepID=A0ABS0B2C0_9BACT|nr:DUF502 domain-containing protein [Candidatus Neptunochlamydia vexilliferae]MBF5059871.1 hypothetical protein [Candidatus Neptunochlamydia vexilliferae]